MVVETCKGGNEMNSEQKIKDALVALDKAVQEWYQENNPDNKEHYASVCICEDVTHVCRITLNSDVEGIEYVTIEVSKQEEE